MAYTLEQLSADIRETLTTDFGVAGKQLAANPIEGARSTTNPSPST